MAELKKIEKQREGEEESSNESSDSGHDDDQQKIEQCKATLGQIYIDREEYLQAHRDLVHERTQAQLKNNLLHRRLSEYYKKRKQDHVLKALDVSADLEEKYHQKLLAFEELTDKEERETADIKSKLEAVRQQYLKQSEECEKQFEELQHHEKAVGTGLIYSKKGKPIADKTVQRFLSLQKCKSDQASSLRLRYIRARNAVADLEAVVRRLERIGPGVYVAQYEQLKIDNENLVNKIEEREDELIKNRTKCTEHNQMLAHIREKMQHTDEVIDLTECDLGDAEIEYQRAREELADVKGRRDRLRWALEAERVRAGLLTRKDLLRDYQDATDQVVKLREKRDFLDRQIRRTIQELRVARKSAAADSSNSSHMDFFGQL